MGILATKLRHRRARRAQRLVSRTVAQVEFMIRRTHVKLDEIEKAKLVGGDTSLLERESAAIQEQLFQYERDFSALVKIREELANKPVYDMIDLGLKKSRPLLPTKLDAQRLDDVCNELEHACQINSHAYARLKFLLTSGQPKDNEAEIELQALRRDQ